MTARVFQRMKCPCSLVNLCASSEMLGGKSEEVGSDCTSVSIWWRRWEDACGYRVLARQGKGVVFVLRCPLLIDRQCLLERKQHPIEPFSPLPKALYEAATFRTVFHICTL